MDTGSDPSRDLAVVILPDQQPASSLAWVRSLLSRGSGGGLRAGAGGSSSSASASSLRDALLCAPDEPAACWETLIETHGIGGTLDWDELRAVPLAALLARARTRRLSRLTLADLRAGCPPDMDVVAELREGAWEDQLEPWMERMLGLPPPPPPPALPPRRQPRSSVPALAEDPPVPVPIREIVVGKTVVVPKKRSKAERDIEMRVRNIQL